MSPLPQNKASRQRNIEAASQDKSLEFFCTSSILSDTSRPPHDFTTLPSVFEQKLRDILLM